MMFVPPPQMRWGTGIASPQTTTPEAPKGFFARLGLKDPRVAAMIASQILSAPNLMQALGALGQGPALMQQFQDEEADRAEEEARRKREEEDRRLRIQFQEAEEKRRAAAEEARIKEEARRDELFERQAEARRAFDQELSAAEVSGKVDPGLARLLRIAGPDEGYERLRSQLYPTEDERRHAEMDSLQLQNVESLIESRDKRASNAGYTDPRLLIKDQLGTVGRQIDDLRANAPKEYSPEYPAYQAKMDGLELEYQKLKESQARLENPAGAQPVIRMSVESFAKSLESLPAFRGNSAKATALAQDLSRAGILEEVIRLMREGNDLRTAMMKAGGR